MNRILLTGLFALCCTLNAGTPYEPLTADEDTIFLIQPTEEGLRDVTGKIGKVSSLGGEVKRDENGNLYFHLEGEKTGILIPDDGSISFKDGLSIEAYVYLEKPLSNKSGFMLKIGTGSFSFTKGQQLTVDWFSFAGEKIYVEPGAKRFDYYPVGDALCNGFLPLPTGKWVHLAFTYDPEMRTYRTWIDRGVDRISEMQREYPASGPLMVSCEKSPFRFFEGLANARIGQIKLSSKPIEFTKQAPLNIYVNELPWQDKVLVSLEQISKKLSLPADIVVFVENGGVASSKRFVLEKRETTSFEIPVTWGRGWGTRFSMYVQVYENNTRVMEREFVLSSPPHPKGPWKINPDRSLSYEDKKVFPICLYGVFEEDFPLVAELGFTMAMPHDPKRRFYSIFGSSDEELAIQRELLKDASDSKLKLIMCGGGLNNTLRRVEYLRNEPGLGFWYAYDEPFGLSLKRLRDSYNAIKLTDPNMPVAGVQNNPRRLRESAMGVDIVGVDSYPIPGCALRSIYDSTRYALKGGFFRKPVLTVICSYGPDKIPTEDEFRCMAYLAIIGGANMLGVYAWDERVKDQKAYYAKDHPEVISTFKSVIGELHRLDDVLPEPNIENDPLVEREERGIFAAVKRAKGKEYLFIASDSRREEKFTVTYPPAGNANAKNMSSGNFKGDFSFVNGKADLTVPPLGAAVFELPGPIGK